MKNEILDRLKTALLSTTLTQFGKRLETQLQAQFSGTVQVYKAKDSYHRSTIRVWHGGQSVEVGCYLKGDNWKADILADIERSFTYDADERATQEAALIPELTDWVIIDAMGLSNFGCDVRWVGLYTAIVIDSRGESVCMLEKVR